MVVIEVFTPVVQRILKHNMVSDWTASGGRVWPVLVSGSAAVCSLFSRAVVFLHESRQESLSPVGENRCCGWGRGFHTAWSPLLKHRRYSALRGVEWDSSLLKDGQAQ